MTTLLRWQGSTDPTKKNGTATFTLNERLLQVPLASFDDARALDEFIDLAVLRARRSVRAACSSYIRAAATHLEHSE